VARWEDQRGNCLPARLIKREEQFALKSRSRKRESGSAQGGKNLGSEKKKRPSADVDASKVSGGLDGKVHERRLWNCGKKNLKNVQDILREDPGRANYERSSLSKVNRAGLDGKGTEFCRRPSTEIPLQNECHKTVASLGTGWPFAGRKC